MVFSKRSFSWASFVGSISRYHPLDEVIVELGYLGLFMACFLTATLVPLSPEVILVVLIAKGFNLQICIAIACVGNWLAGLQPTILVE